MMKYTKAGLALARLICLLVLAITASVSGSAFAYNDGGLTYENSTGSRSTLKKKHLNVEHESSAFSNASDYNFIGFQGSLGLANQSAGGVSIDSSNRLRMMWGAYYERRFIPYLGMRAGIDFNMRGFSTTAQNGVSDDYGVNYLEFPLQLKAQIPTSIVTPYVAVGPFLGVALGKSHSASFQGRSQDVQGFDTLINGINFGLNFGGGIDFQIVRHLNVEIGARYSLGLVNVLTNAGQQTLAQAANQNNDGGGEVLPAAVTLHLNDIQFLTGLSYSL